MEVKRESLEELLEIAGSDMLCAEARREIEWKLKKLLEITVRKIAERIIEENASYYSKDLLQLIPEELLNTELTNENLHKIGVQIDKIRFEKENELAVMLQLTADQKERLNKAINGGFGTLTPKQENKIREIKFLSNLAQVIIHQ